VSKIQKKGMVITRKDDYGLNSPGRKKIMKSVYSVKWITEIEMDVQRSFPARSDNCYGDDNDDDNETITMTGVNCDFYVVDYYSDEDDDNDYADADADVDNTTHDHFNAITSNDSESYNDINKAINGLVFDVVGVVTGITTTNTTTAVAVKTTDTDADTADKARNYYYSNEATKRRGSSVKSDGSDARRTSRTSESSATNDDSDIITKQGKLRRVLWAFCAWNPKVGYCQGMNMIARYLLEICDDGGSLTGSDGCANSCSDEETCFDLLCGLCDACQMESMWCDGMMLLDMCFYVLDRIVSIYLPSLARCFKSHGIHMNMFASRWFLALFCSDDVIDKAVTRRVWDIFVMTKNWTVVFKASLAVLTVLEKEILAKDFEGILKILGNVKATIDDLEEKNTDKSRGSLWELLGRAVSEFELDSDVVREMQEEYLAQHGKTNTVH
jgi:hypothetical protein